MKAKRIISLLLSILLIVSVLTVTGVTVGAESISSDEQADIGSVNNDLTEVGAESGTINIENETTAETQPAEAPQTVDYPVITKIVNTGKGAEISWDSYGDSTRYRIYYRKAAVYSGSWDEKYGSASWTRLAEVKGNTYTHAGVKDGEIGIYTVRGLDENKEFTTEYYTQGWENYYYSSPVISSISFDESGVHLKWSRSWQIHGFNNGERYRVFRRTSSTSWSRIADTDAGSYTDDTAVPGVTYTYTVRMINRDGSLYISDHTKGKSVQFDAYPLVTSITNTETGVKLSWLSYPSASVYRVYYRTSNGWNRIASVSGLSYTDTSVKNGETRVYTVRALDSDDDFISDFKREGWSNRYYSAPVIRSLSADVKGVRIKWSRASGAEDYRVYRKTSNGWNRLTQTSDSEYIDTTAVSGKTYTYTLRMISADGEVFMSDYNSGKSITFVAAPKITHMTNTETGVKLTWDKVAGADFYRIYYRSNSGWTRLASKYKTEYVDTSVKNGETRVYTVRCLDENEDFVSDFYHEGYSNTFFTPPVISSLTADAKGITVSWNRMTGAEDYRVYRKTTGSWTRLGQTDESSFTDTTADKGVKYTYTIRMITHDGERFMSDYDSGKSILVCDTPEFSSLSNGEKGVLLRWNAVKGAYKYRVYSKADSGWSRLGELTDTSFTDTSVKDGETRIYTIRCLDIDDEFVSDFNRDGWSFTYSAPPVLTSVSYAGGSYKLKWNSKPEAAAYRVYRKALGDTDWQTLASSLSDTTYTDKTAADNVIYSYTLRSLDADGNLISSYISDSVYYKNGSVVTGTQSVGGTSYKFINGKLAKGYIRENSKLYYYKGGRRVTGTIVGSASEGYYYADNSGICYESEDMRLTAEFMMRYCSGSTLQEKMKSGYLYIAHKYAYARRMDPPSSGSDMPPYAVDMFTNHSGDCYRYAVCFAYMAKIAGYRVRVGIGETGGSHAAHGWTEVYVNGKWLYCDAQAEIPRWEVPDYSRYMMENHAWAVITDWHTELILSNGKVNWGAKTS